MDPLIPFVRALQHRAVRFVIIGVAGANYFSISGSTQFATQDRDLFLPPDTDTLLHVWQACDEAGLSLSVGLEPLDGPRDRELAGRVIERRVTTRASNGTDLDVDLTFIMEGFDFETVWRERRTFTVDGTEIPVARLLHIVASKQATGRDKDRLFLATHKQALADLLKSGE